MTTDRITATAINIAQNLLDENIDHPDAWIPVKRSDLDIMSAAFERYRQLEANLANMLTLLNGAAPGNPDPQVGKPPAAELTATDIAQNVGGLDWLYLASQDLDTPHLRFVEHITGGTVTWRKLEDATKRHLIYWIIWRIQRALDDETITVNLYESMKPDWAPKASSLYKHKTFSDWVVDAMEAHADAAAPFRAES